MKFVFEEDAVWTKLLEGDPSVVDKLLCIPDPKRIGDYSFNNKLWDGLQHFFSVEKSRLPSGLFPRLQMRLNKRGHEVVTSVTTSVTLSPVKEVEPDFLEGIDLRDYQIEAINAALITRRGILWQATGAGKAEIIAAISGQLCRTIAAKGIVVVPNQTVFTEVYNRLKLRLGNNPKLGCFGAGEHRMGQIIIATYQTLDGEMRRKGQSSKLVQFLQECDFIMVDEAHHAAASAYQKILKSAENAFWRIGFTGTADKNTKRRDADAVSRTKDKARWHRWHMEQFLGPVIDRIENSFMIEQGYSAKPRIVVIEDRNCFGPMVIPPQGKRTKDGTYEPPVNLYGKVFRMAAIEDQRWLKNIVKVIRLLIASGKPPFVFSHSIDHIKAIEAMCKERDVDCKVLHGEHEKGQRLRVLKEFAERKDFAVLCSTIFDEGLSLNEIRALVLAGARRTTVELLQRIGRGIRKKSEDNTLIVVDFIPKHSEMLWDQAKERLAVYIDQGFEVTSVNDVTRLTEFL